MKATTRTKQTNRTRSERIAGRWRWCWACSSRWCFEWNYHQLWTRSHRQECPWRSWSTSSAGRYQCHLTSVAGWQERLHSSFVSMNKKRAIRLIPSISSTPAPQQQQITGAYQGPPETPYIIFLVQYVYALTFTANNNILAAISWLAIDDEDIGKLILFNTNNNEWIHSSSDGCP